MVFICYSIWSADPYEEEPSKEKEYDLVMDNSQEKNKVEEIHQDEANSSHPKSE